MEIANEIRRIGSDHERKGIPKPEAKGVYRVKGMGRRRGEEALIYTIPSQKGNRPHEKGITISEFTLALSELNHSGEITRSWFNETLLSCAEEGDCNFTTIGGVFEILGLAEYHPRGRYVRVQQSA